MAKLSRKIDFNVGLHGRIFLKIKLKVMKRAASCKHRHAVKTIQSEKKLFNSHLHSS